ncbi:MAG TPA: ABC transporter permease [Gammaproteobacteria bacterium]
MSARVEGVARDVRHAVRALRRSPFFTLMAVLTLAIGVGANTAVFSVVDGVLLKPLPYPEADRLVSVWHDAPGAPGLTAIADGLQISPSMLVTYREENRSFESIGLWTQFNGSVTGLAEPEQVRMAAVTGGVMASFRTAPLLGRWITEADEDPQSPPVVVLGYGYWQRRFGGSPDVIGITVSVNSVVAEIVGVMPEGFRFGDYEADVIRPYEIDRAELIPPPFCCFGVARLRPGVTLEQANADVERMLPIWIERFPLSNGVSGRAVYLDGWQIRPALRPLKADVVGNVGDALWVVAAMIGIVLLIACANVTNLLLVRGERRAREFGVRAALGAGGWRIAGALLVEAALLALAGGALGVVLAHSALKVLLALAPPQLPRLDSIVLDGRAIAFALVATVVAASLVALAPVLRAARVPMSTASRSVRGGSTDRMQQRAQNALVVAQVALALVLLVGAGLMIRTFDALRSVDPGFDAPESVQTFRIQFPPNLVPDPRAVLRQQRDIVDALEAIPAVASAGFVSGVPMEGGGTNWDGIDVEGAEYGPEGDLALRVYKTVSPGYLETMGTRIVAGRDLDWADLDEPRDVVLVSENLARELWQTPEAAIGRRIRGAGGAGPWREVIGVVEDVRLNAPDQPPPTIVYWPAFIAGLQPDLPLYAERAVAFTVRSTLAGTPSLTREIERAVWSVNPDLPLANVRTMQQIYDRSLARTSFTLVMLVLAAGAALVLGVIGLYGVLSYAVSQRRREIAIRLALGEQQRDVRRRFVAYGVTLAALGVVIGLAAASGATQLMSAVLYDVRPVDPPTFVAVAAVLTLVAVAASYLPARRASAVDPAESLASE